MTGQFLAKKLRIYYPLLAMEGRCFKTLAWGAGITECDIWGSETSSPMNGNSKSNTALIGGIYYGPSEA